ncbi:MAG TPA: hypothetical protein VE987_06225 [Polyangiaceae bacterium]|nr:hypothetical protein [Polyangiaceae bacterium]
MLKALTAYLLTAMLAWMPTKNQKARETADAALARYQSIASDVATVALDPAEPPLFKGADGRTKTALVLLSVAWWESAFRPDVDSGNCKPPECDNGHAFTLWQLHPEDGFIFDGDVYTFARNRTPAWRADHASEIFDGAALLRDRKLAAKIALHMMRYSVLHSGGLGIYTGENGNGPKAKQRMDHALKWLREHPFTG